MLKKINYYWRVFATGLSFFTFGVGGLLLRIAIFPMLNILIWKQKIRITFARHIIRFSFRGFIEFMRVLGVLRYNICGLEQLEREGLLILANHPTLIDTVFLMAFVKQADCIVKSTLWHNPFMRGPIKAAGYICNNGGFGLIEDCLFSLRNGSNLIIFPEGTRTEREGKINFKRGAANIAVRGMCNITPVIIRCTPSTLTKGEKWWEVPSIIPHFTIEVQKDINIKIFLAKPNNETLAARQLAHYLQDYYLKES
jgi:1-acyl-sn-glycerol-3-phosphate acyltransferase